MIYVGDIMNTTGDIIFSFLSTMGGCVLYHDHEYRAKYGTKHTLHIKHFFRLNYSI